MTFDAVLNLLGLVISLAGIVVARPTGRILIVVLFSAIGVTAGVALFLDYRRSLELDRMEAGIKSKLAHNRWTAERIAAEVRGEDKALVRDALARAADAGRILDIRTECVMNDGNVLPVRLFYAAPP